MEDLAAALKSGREDQAIGTGPRRPTSPRQWPWWFVAGYCALIFAGSSIPGNDVPGVGWSDKVLHTIEYIVLGGLLMFALVRTTGWRLGIAFLVALALGSLYGISDELHQMITPRRDSSGLDVVADVIGSGIGAAAVLCVALVRRRGRQSRHVDHT